MNLELSARLSRSHDIFFRLAMAFPKIKEEVRVIFVLKALGRWAGYDRS